MNKKGFIFLTEESDECKVCGISSFSHLHTDRNRPKDFQTISSRKQVIRESRSTEEAPHRIPFENWINSQLSVVKFNGSCTINGKFDLA
jgi:hypothetical protein